MDMPLLKSTAAVAAVSATFALAVLPAPTQAQAPIQSLAWDFAFFGVEASTTSTAPGAPLIPVLPVVSSSESDGDGVRFYEKTFRVAGANVLRVTLSTTGDTHDGAASLFSCVVTDPDGTRRYCNPRPDGASFGPAGWVTLLKEPVPTAVTNCNRSIFGGDGGGGPADCHDNGIHYTWCTPIRRPTGVYTVELWMATDTLGDRVFIETAYFFVDQTKIVQENRCVELTPDGFSAG